MGRIDVMHCFEIYVGHFTNNDAGHVIDELTLMCRSVAGAVQASAHDPRRTEWPIDEITCMCELVAAQVIIAAHVVSFVTA